MKKNIDVILYANIFFILILIPTINPVFGQDIAELSSEKYLLQVDDQTFQIFYGFKGSLEVAIGANEIQKPIVSSMTINPERLSLKINFDETAYEGPMWVRLPNELITADEGKFRVIIDDKETIYELTYYTEKIAVGFIIPPKTSYVEIIGTRIIPEFQELALMVLGSSIVFVITFANKCTKLAKLYNL